MTQARTLFLGTGPFGIPTLHWLARAPSDAPFRLVGAVTSPGRPAGRDRAIRPGPVEAAARSDGVPEVILAPRLRERDTIDPILALEPSLIVLADDGRLVPAELLGLRHGALNLHPSLLPRHRGATPIPAAIMAGDTETGVTIIRMDEGIDTGPIVAVERVPLAGTETAPDLEATLAEVARDLLARTIGPWLRGEISSRSQPAAGATTTRLLRRDDGRLDPAMPVVALERRVRALQPWPGTFILTGRGPILVHAAAVAPIEPGDRAGTLVAAGAGLALVASGGRLLLERVQPPGGRVMSGAELRRGRPWLVGESAG